MKRTATTLLLSLLLPLFLSRCSDSAAHETAGKPAIAVETAVVTPADLEETIAVVGTLTAKFEGEVKAEYSGTITDVYVTEWVPVKKGTLLARFDTREPEAALGAYRAARMQAEVAATRAKRELERSEQLKTAGLATQQSLDDARTAWEAADAALGAAKAQEEMARTRLEKCEVRAPMDGVVAERTVNPGDFIENMGGPAPMFRVVDNRKLELQVSVPSSAISTIALGQPLRFSTDAIPGKTFEGRVSFINPAADMASRTVRVVALVDNKDGALKTGLFAKGSIVTGERKGVLSIPRSALVTWDPATRTGVVYVVEGETAKRKDVVTGTSAGEMIPLEMGLAAGETVVTRGAFNLKEGDRVKVTGGKKEAALRDRGPRTRAGIANFADLRLPANACRPECPPAPREGRRASQASAIHQHASLPGSSSHDLESLRGPSSGAARPPQDGMTSGLREASPLLGA